MNSQYNAEVVNDAVPEQGSITMPEMPGIERSERAASQALEQGASVPTAPPPIPGAGLPAVTTSVQDDNASDDVPPIPSLALPHIADDADLIEKEWVEKAKEIVARTSNDPFMQNIEMNKVKADYIKKRYNKDIKVLGSE
jgi:hypothetical protein